MELIDALRARRMTRSFDGRPIDLTALEQMAVEALRAPSAGNSAGVSIALAGGVELEGYFAVATDASWRERSTRWPGLSRAGAVAVVTCDPAAYTSRYAESDKAASGLGDRDAWPVPYWYADAAMAALALLLLIEEAQWGATLWGNFRHDKAVLSWAGADEGSELFGSVLIGHPDGQDHRSASLDRDVPLRRDRVRRVLGE